MISLIYTRSSSRKQFRNLTISGVFSIIGTVILSDWNPLHVVIVHSSEHQFSWQLSGETQSPCPNKLENLLLILNFTVRSSPMSWSCTRTIIWWNTSRNFLVQVVVIPFLEFRSILRNKFWRIRVWEWARNKSLLGLMLVVEYPVVELFGVSALYNSKVLDEILIVLSFIPNTSVSN